MKVRYTIPGMTPSITPVGPAQTGGITGPVTQESRQRARTQWADRVAGEVSYETVLKLDRVPLSATAIDPPTPPPLLPLKANQELRNEHRALIDRSVKLMQDPATTQALSPLQSESIYDMLETLVRLQQLEDRFLVQRTQQARA